jgi:hypothetical protein
LPVETNRGKLRGRLAQSFDLPPQRTATPARPPASCSLQALFSGVCALLPAVFLSQRHQINVARYGSAVFSSIFFIRESSKKKGFLVYFLNARYFTGDKKQRSWLVS